MNLERKPIMPPIVEGQVWTEVEKLQYKRYLDGTMAVTVEKMLTLKCPRCYLYDGIEDNFMQICDRCSTQLLEGADTLVEMGRLTMEERDSIVNGIKSAQLAQLHKYE